MWVGTYLNGYAHSSTGPRPRQHRRSASRSSTCPRTRMSTGTPGAVHLDDPALVCTCPARVDLPVRRHVHRHAHVAIPVDVRHLRPQLAFPGIPVLTSISTSSSCI